MDRWRAGYFTRMLVGRVRTDGFVDPCIPSRALKPPAGPDWVHEVKHDGYRLMVGDSDPIHGRGRDYAFARGVRNPASRYLEVSAGHLTTSLAARSRVVEWLKAL